MEKDSFEMFQWCHFLRVQEIIFFFLMFLLTCLVKWGDRGKMSSALFLVESIITTGEMRFISSQQKQACHYPSHT